MRYFLNTEVTQNEKIRYDKQYNKEYDGIIVELPIENIKDFRICR